MGKDPAVLFYTGDFLVGTMKMNYAQKGKYIQLLCLQHQDGHLSEDDMLSVCGDYDEKIFSKFVKDEEGKYYNERMEVESVKRRRFIESRQRNLIKTDKETQVEQRTEAHMEAHMGVHTEARMENENIIKNKINYNSFIDIYNTQCFNLSQVMKLTDKRKKAIATFLKSMTIEDFEKACIIANNTPFLCGQSKSGWKANFDFIIKVDNATKIIEGVYSGENKSHGLDFMDLA